MKNFWKTTKRPLLVALLIFFLGGFGGLFVQKYLAPYLSTLPVLRQIGFLRLDTPIVITRTEQVRVNEGIRLVDLVKQLSPKVVTIIGGTGQVGRNFSETVRGSGVIISSDGIIATDKNLLADAKNNFSVITFDGKVLHAARLANDPSSDLALLKVEAGSLSATNFGLSSELETAQQIVLLSGSGTSNSAKYRTSYVSLAPGTESLANVYSTERLRSNFGLDATSLAGEALFNLSGQLVGMGAGNGIIQAETIKAALDSYFAKKQLVRPQVGLSYTVLTSVISSILGLGVPEGILVRDSSGPAAVAGLRENDVILRVNGEQINSRQGLNVFLNRANPGDEWKLTILRAGSESELTLKIETAR